MRRLVIAAALGAAVAGTAVPSLAAQISTPKQSVPVYVWRDANGGVCFVVSEQVPHCVDPNPVTDILPGQINAGPATVYISTANGTVSVGTALGSQPLVGAWVSGGVVCVGFSEQIPVCTNSVQK
ncbi:MAG: hypothetical protein JO079_14105 [Frankiaceae bacterium]|nr:hypothetical protein [Frankiaceae bacterium]MBV9369241.1 hypothetical protein [Frankiales bacterium]